MAGGVIYLRRGGVGVVLARRPDALPAVLHWGVDLGEAPVDSLPALLSPVVAHSALDAPAPMGLLPEYAAGYAGRPGLQVLRGARRASWSPAFRGVAIDAAADGSAVVIEASDPDLELALHSELALEESGLLRLRHRVTNTGDEPLWVLALHATLPVPAHAAEVLDLTGRWSRERSPQRRPFHDGAVVRESRRGRTGHDATLVMAAGTAGFGFETGEIWAVHVAWSGDHVTYAERLPEGHRALGGGELLGPGEIELASGESYESPQLLASWSQTGLNGVAARWHDWMRARPSHPSRPRPVVLNTWEAVYFDHDLTVPPEMVGSHVGAPTAHTTGRTHTLGFRAVAAFFGHLGVEWDLTRASDPERAELAEWIALHKQERSLLHTGRVVVADPADPATAVHGVVAADGQAAIFAVVSLATSARAVPAPLRLPGLEPEHSYRIERLGPAPAYGSLTTGWLEDGSVEASGLVLVRVGVAMPVLLPETALLLKAVAIG